MKKLVIHIGYPRTATTTLQSVLFYNLHKRDKIKYFGKSYSDEHKYNIAREIFRNWIARENSWHEIQVNFSSKKVNLISLDELTFPEYFTRNYLEEKLNKSNPLVYPEKISRLSFLDEIDNLEILVTLRNQMTAIYSHYTQLYKYFHLKNDKNLKSWEDYLNNGLNKEKSILSTYYYNDILKTYARIFGDQNIKILFFEDLKKDKKYFKQELAHVLEMNPNTIRDDFLGKQKNKRKKTSRGSVGNEIKGRKVLSSLYENKFLKAVYNKMRGNRYGNYFMKKIFFQEHLIEDLKKNHRDKINQEFRKSNLKLVENFNICEEKLREYEYI